MSMYVRIMASEVLSSLKPLPLPPSRPTSEGVRGPVRAGEEDTPAGLGNASIQREGDADGLCGRGDCADDSRAVGAGAWGGW